MRTTIGFREAVDAAYAAFSDIPCPTRLRTSPFRDGAEILARLTAAHLRELPEETIGPYAGWAITTVGDERDFMHFLPRIIELAAYDGGHVGLEPQVIASRLVMAGWAGWNEPKQAAVKRCFREAFLLRLHSIGAAEWLCGIAHLGLLSDDLFDRWLIAPEDGAIEELAHFIKDDLGLEGMTGGTWEAVSAEAQRRVAHWARSDAVRGRLQAALDRASPSSRKHIEAALAVIGRPDARGS